MLDYDLEEELSEIPAEYQDAFRQAIEQELTDTEQNHTDSDILTYLRQRRDDFKRGGFIRPDGRPGMMTLNPETMYEKALPELTQSSLGEPDDRDEKRRTLIKIGLFAIVIIAFLIVVFRGRAQREDAADVALEDVPAEIVAANGTPAPTPPLPELSGVDDSLQTIGSLGGALSIGRPSAVELYYGGTEETIALAIDPSKPTPKGEMRYSESRMLSDNPVAVWLFGTVLNYGVGIPDSMVRNLESGDRITLSTDTGTSLHFIVTETGTVANYETSRLLSQNRLGLTLFSLPAVTEDDVSFAIANYDIASEEDQGQAAYGVGERFLLGNDASLEITTVQFNHTASGDIRIVVGGNVTNSNDSQSIMLSLTSSSEQTTAVQLSPDDDGDWQASFIIPDSVTYLPLFAEFRALPDGNLAIVQLGETPRLTEQLEIEIVGAWWQGEQDQIVVDIAVHNPGEGAVYLGTNFIQFPTEGGDAYEATGQVTPRLPGQVIPRLPLLINPGETTGITVSFLPQDAPVQLQIDADLWEVTSLHTDP